MASEFEKLRSQYLSRLGEQVRIGNADILGALVAAYDNGFVIGERSFRERAAKECEGMHCSANDGYGLSCHRVDAKAIRLMKTEGEK